MEKHSEYYQKEERQMIKEIIAHKELEKDRQDVT
jgi:hypothetical protein